MCEWCVDVVEKVKLFGVEGLTSPSAPACSSVTVPPDVTFWEVKQNTYWHIYCELHTASTAVFACGMVRNAYTT